MKTAPVTCCMDAAHFPSISLTLRQLQAFHRRAELKGHLFIAR